MLSGVSLILRYFPLLRHNDFLFILIQLKLIPAVIEDLSSTSAYKAFEQHCCILQVGDKQTPCRMFFTAVLNILCACLLTIITYINILHARYFSFCVFTPRAQQKVEPTGLTINERVQFWCNIYNTITVHAIISKGSPGSTLLERSAFMRSSKYNIGGILHSLLDVRHRTALYCTSLFLSCSVSAHSHETSLLPL